MVKQKQIVDSRIDKEEGNLRMAYRYGVLPGGATEIVNHLEDDPLEVGGRNLAPVPGPIVFGPSRAEKVVFGKVRHTKKTVNGRDILHDVEGGAVLTFEPTHESPYLHSLAGEYDLPLPDGPPLLVSGTCPVCNNSDCKMIDRMLVSGKHIKDVARISKISVMELQHHLKYHAAPIYYEAANQLRLLCEARLEGNERFHGLSNKYLKELAELTPEYDKQRMEGGAGTPTGDIADPPVKQDYAIVDGVQKKRLRPWTKRRAEMEIITKAGDALNYYDEMMDIREKVSRVYDRIVNKDNPKEDDPERYSVAIAATRELRGIVTDLAKMSLIAQKLGDGREGEKKLSGPLAALVDSIYAGNALPEKQSGEPVPAEDPVAEFALVDSGIDNDMAELEPGSDIKDSIDE